MRKFRHALVADPAFAYRWSDLGDALSEAGDKAQAAFCYERSLAIGASAPPLLLRAANFHFENGENLRALDLSRQTLAAVSDYDSLLFSNYLRFSGIGHDTWDRGIGANRRAALSFFRYLLNAPGTKDPAGSWQWLEDQSFADSPTARLYSDWLLAQDKPADAADIWARHVALDPHSYRVSNWIDDGGFERESTHSGFGWNLDSVTGADVSLDNRISHSGSRSLRIIFNGEANVDFRHVSELVWLEPGSYVLSAWVRSDALTTDQGVGLHVSDSSTDPAISSTPALIGTHGWTELKAAFRINEKPQLVRVKIVRQHSWDFDNKPRGTAWIDDVMVSRTN